MSKSKSVSKGLTWKHVVIAVVLVWLLAGLIGGESLKAGSIEFGLPGCSMRAKEVQRDVPGLPLKSADNKPR